MRTLGSQPPNKQYKITGETLYIYAPLANRLGLNKIKTELENLSFKYEHPEIYNEIQGKLKATEAHRDEVFKNFTAPIRAQLDKMGLKYEIIARVKSIYSIWNKMQTKHLPFEEIYDLLAVRIIFTPKNEEEELNECFNIYVSISKIYRPHPDRLRDWVSHPKANGYQALHVTLMKERQASIKERLLQNVQEINGVKLIRFVTQLPAEAAKNIAFQLRGEITENLLFVAGTEDEDKPMLTVMISDNLVNGGLNAGKLVKEAAKLIQGGGGGQAHFATAGGKNKDGLNAAVDKIIELAGL